MSTDNSTMQVFNSDARILGACWVVYGVIRLVMAVCLLIYSGTATVMFGALLTRAPNPFGLMTDFHFLYAAMIALSFVCGILGIIAGIALVAENGSSRMLALIAAVLSLSNIPLGTMLGAYTLVALLPAGPGHLHGRDSRAYSD